MKYLEIYVELVGVRVSEAWKSIHSMKEKELGLVLKQFITFYLRLAG